MSEVGAAGAGLRPNFIPYVVKKRLDPFLIEKLLTDEAARAIFRDAAEEYFNRNKSKVAGRLSTAVVINFILGSRGKGGLALGQSLNLLAIYGDTRDAIAKGNSDPKSIAASILGGTTK